MSSEQSSDQNLPTPFDGEQADADVGSDVDTLPAPSDLESGTATADDGGLPTPFDADSRTVADYSGSRSSDQPTPFDGLDANADIDAGAGGQAAGEAAPVPDQPPSADLDNGGAGDDAGLPRPDDEGAPA